MKKLGKSVVTGIALIILALTLFSAFTYKLGPAVAASSLCKKSEDCLRGLSISNSGANQLLYSADGRQLFAHGVAGARRWDTEAFRVKTLDGGRSRKVAVALDGRYAVARDDGEVRLFDPEGEKLLEFSTLEQGLKNINKLVFTPGYDMLAIPIGGEAAGLSFWSTRNGQFVTRLPHTSGITSLTASSSGVIAAGQFDGNIVLWPVSDFSTGISLPASEEAIWSLAFNADGSVLASGDSRGMVKLWDVATGALLNEFRQVDSLVTGLGLSPDASRVVVAHSSGVLEVWDRESSSILASWQYSREIGEIAVSPDASQVAIALRKHASIVETKERPYSQRTPLERSGVSDNMADSYVKVDPAVIIIRDLTPALDAS